MYVQSVPEQRTVVFPFADGHAARPVLLERYNSSSKVPWSPHYGIMYDERPGRCWRGGERNQYYYYVVCRIQEHMLASWLTNSIADSR